MKTENGKLKLEDGRVKGDLKRRTKEFALKLFVDFLKHRYCSGLPKTVSVVSVTYPARSRQFISTFRQLSKRENVA